MTISVENLSANGVGHVMLEDVSWETYESLLNDIGNGTTRVTYDEGRMEIMSPLPKHDRVKRLIGLLIQNLSYELNIPIASYGSTTFKLPQRKKGLEPDEGYYFAHEAEMRWKEEIDLNVDPPPDLVVEIDISYRSIKREPIYAMMGVPEVWRYDGNTLECLLLDGSGQYRVAEFSKTFSLLKPVELLRFVDIAAKSGKQEMTRVFREWAKSMHA